MPTNITPGQNKRFHALLNQAGLVEKEKRAMILEVTNGRTDSSRMLTEDEARQLIQHLEESQMHPPATKDQEKAASANQMRRRILSICHTMQWYIKGTQKVDMARVDAFCQARGYLKKKLNDYTQPELPKLVSQFDQLLVKHLKSL